MHIGNLVHQRPRSLILLVYMSSAMSLVRNGLDVFMAIQVAYCGTTDTGQSGRDNQCSGISTKEITKHISLNCVDIVIKFGTAAIKSITPLRKMVLRLKNVLI